MSTAVESEGLAVVDLQAAFGSNIVLHGINVTVAPGETLVLFGPSGAGKTVLLRAIAGLDPNATGVVRIAGRDVSMLGPERRGVGVAFQNFALYPHMSARKNIASPLEAQRLDDGEIASKVQVVAELLKIAHVLDNRPRALSNGQKQRTALARVLVGEPRVLLLDDPLRNVDAKLRYEMRTELPQLLRRSGAAAIYVTQDYREAMALGDRVAVLIGGRIVQVAPPEVVYDMPATVDVARLFGDPPLNLVPCRLSAEGPDARACLLGLDLELPAAADACGRDQLIGLRPEALDVSPTSSPGAAATSLVAVTPMHGKSVLLLRCKGGTELLATMVGTSPPPGATLWLRPAPASLRLYDRATGLLHPGAAAAARNQAA